MVNYPPISIGFPAYLEDVENFYRPPPAQGADLDQFFSIGQCLPTPQDEEKKFDFDWEEFNSNYTPGEVLTQTSKTETAVEAPCREIHTAAPVLMDIENCSTETKQETEDLSEPPKVNFTQLRATIEKLLQGFEPSDQLYQSFNDTEQVILNSIYEKKFLSDEDGKNKGKRVEEKQKLFFKAALKYSENKYFSNLQKSNKKKLKKRDFDQHDFYESYFSESARKFNCDLSNFFHPNRKLKSTLKKSQCTFDDGEGHAGLKSFNSTYIDLILSSEEFRSDAIEFLDNYFVQEYVKTRLQKIDKVLKQVIKVIENAWADYQYSRPSEIIYEKRLTLKEFIRNKVKDNIINNSKSKLPWSNEELERTKIFAIQRIQKAEGNLNANF